MRVPQFEEHLRAVRAQNTEDAAMRILPLRMLRPMQILQTRQRAKALRLPRLFRKLPRTSLRTLILYLKLRKFIPLKI